MEEQNRTVFYIMIAVIFAMIAGSGYMFYQRYNEMHDRFDRAERKIKKEEKEAEEKMVKVPDVRGMTYKEAVEVLEDAGFVVGDTIIQSGDLDTGTVTKTVPSAGIERPNGSYIIIYIAE